MPQQPAADIGLIGLAVMGENLALNIADHGFKVAVYNRTTETMRHFIEKNPNTPGGLIACETIEQLVQSIKRPRKFIILVKAGPAVDAVVKQLIDAGIATDDIVVDCGNSLWTDTIRREKDYAKQCKFFGSGVSGGEVGARFGPSMMPGGDPDSWKHLKPIWEAVAAKVDAKTGRPIETGRPGKPVVGGVPCTAYIGPNGAGHYVKMIHNGIEYIDMQLICEAYFLMQNLLGMKANEIGEVFSQWNEGDLDSYLIQITADILKQPDPLHKDGYLVDYVLDTAGQKGTGRWTSQVGLDLGVPIPTMNSAIEARFISRDKAERVAASKEIEGPSAKFTGDKKELIDAIRAALYASKITSYAQGMNLIREGSKVNNWGIDLGELSRIWKGGCIIRAQFLDKIKQAYLARPDLPNLLVDPYFKEWVSASQAKWRTAVTTAQTLGVPTLAMSASLAYFDSYRAANLPANLTQAQRDYFGAHTYERVDKPGAPAVHTNWQAKAGH